VIIERHRLFVALIKKLKAFPCLAVCMLAYKKEFQDQSNVLVR
jgi:hypothetical protein